jgi:hypothetical protein
MNWRRIPRDRDPKHYKEWQAGRGKYRVTWRDQVEGVTVTPCYRACMLLYVVERDAIMWEFVDTKKKPRHRTLKAAKAACEKHANPSVKRPRKKTKKRKKK